jgi:rubrerythrin
MEKKFFQPGNPKRQMLIKPLVGISSDGESMPASMFAEAAPSKSSKGAKAISEEVVDMTLIKNQIQSVAELRLYLRTALQLELSTIPPYLCGLYTIKEGTNQEASALIRGVAVEEMLHMVLVANLLNAISSEEDLKNDRENKELNGKLFNVEKIIPNYPTPLPGNIKPPIGPKGSPAFEVSLLKFSQEAIDEFCTIERPSDPLKPVKPKKKNNLFPEYEGIGQFYEAIRYGLYRFKKEITKKVTLNGKTYYKFIGDVNRQVGPEHYYGSGGKILKVEFFGNSLKAIEEIVGQGEGIDGTIQDPDYEMFGEEIEVAHFFKFQEINHGKKYRPNDTNYDKPTNSIPSGPSLNRSWTTVYNMKPNPKMKDYEGNPQLLELAKKFNEIYVTLLNNINDAVSGHPEKLIEGISVMYELKYKAMELLNIPLNNKEGQCAGPTFEFVKV